MVVIDLPSDTASPVLDRIPVALISMDIGSTKYEVVFRRQESFS